MRQDPAAEFLAAHGKSTALGIGQAQRPRTQVLPEDPILFPEIVDQIVLVAGHPASERENEQLQRRGHGLRLLGSLGRFFAPYAYHGTVFSGYFGRVGSLLVRVVERMLGLGTDRIAVLSEQQRREIVDG